MLDEDLRVSLPTEEDLPYSDEKPVDRELQLLAGFLLWGILNHIWSDRFDWLFAVNLGMYPDPCEPAIAPDAFLSLGVERVRENNKLRLSYLLYQENVMPQWVLEVVSKKPGGEYSTKFRRYAEMRVLYYVVYNPSHYRRDKHEMFEVYRLEKGQYILQVGNPVWIPEIGLGIGHEKSYQEGVNRDWLFWYNEEGDRYLPPGDALEQEKILRGREKLIRRSLEDQLEQERLESASRLEQEHRSLILKMIEQNIPLETIARITNLTIEQLDKIG